MPFKRAVDGSGRSVIVGLTHAETLEFDALERSSPVDAGGRTNWLFEDSPTSPSEQRWLELFEKHRLALCLLRLQAAAKLARRRS